MIQIPKTPISSYKKISLLEILQYTVLICIILYYGKILFIPLSFSLLISFILFPVCKWMEGKGLNKILSIIISLSFVLVFISVIIYLLVLQINEFSQEWELFKIKLLETANQISLFITDRFNISSDEQIAFFKNSLNNTGTQTLSIFKIIILYLTESIFYLLMIPILSGLILFYRTILTNALYQIFPLQMKGTVHEILVETIHA